MWQRAFRALTGSVEVRVGPSALRDAVAAMTAGYAPADAAPEVRYELAGGPPFVLWRDGEPIYDSDAAIDLPPALEHDLYRSLIARAGGWPAHAAALEVDGEALLLAGVSGAGKSTMSMALLERGARYLTDEVAAVDAEQRVVGLTRPIGLDAGWPGRVPPGFREWSLSAVTAEGVTITTRTVMPPPAKLAHGVRRAGLVILLRHAPAEPPAAERLAAGEALRRMWELSWRTDPAALEAASALAARVPIISLTTREIGEAVAAVESAWAVRRDRGR